MVSKAAPLGEIVAAIRKTHAGDAVHAAAEAAALQNLARQAREPDTVQATLTRRERQVLQAAILAIRHGVVSAPTAGPGRSARDD